MGYTPASRVRRIDGGKLYVLRNSIGRYFRDDEFVDLERAKHFKKDRAEKLCKSFLEFEGESLTIVELTEAQGQEAARTPESKEFESFKIALDSY